MTWFAVEIGGGRKGMMAEITEKTEEGGVLGEDLRTAAMSLHGNAKPMTETKLKVSRSVLP